jgi:glycosyltransferase involved in cell wall biosynthesis
MHYEPAELEGSEGVTPTEHADGLLALSIIIPLFNEQENVPLIYERFSAVLAGAPEPYRSGYEIIFVDDGSTDRSFQQCAEIEQGDPRVRVVQFRRNFGKTAALQAGFDIARGRRLVTIDADMQEDPAEIFRLLEPLDSGFDIASGWRRLRNDPVSKTLPSRVFNSVVAGVTGISLHDLNCGFKAYSREVVADLRIYGEQHRFIPVLAFQRGFRVTEVPVTHERRRYGRSKFGAKRLGRGFLDFIQVLFLTTYLQYPLRLFGLVGAAFTLLGFAVCAYLAVLWFEGHRPIGDRPLLTLGVLLLITGLQFVSTGLVGEMLLRTRSRAEPEYVVRRILGAAGQTSSSARWAPARQSESK